MPNSLGRLRGNFAVRRELLPARNMFDSVRVNTVDNFLRKEFRFEEVVGSGGGLGE